MLNNLHLYNKGVRVKPRSKHEIRGFARLVRQHFQDDIHKPFDVLNCLEIDLPKATAYDFSFEPKEKGYMKDVEASVSPDDMVMYIRQDVFDALYNNDSRARFTIAHEFGHLFMHKGVATTLNRSNPSAHKPYEDSEWQANQFAAELLAPLDGCIGLSIDEIMKKYNISYQCAALRYKECKSR